MEHFYTIKILIICLLSINSVYSQTAIEPIIGYAFVKNEGLTDFESNNWLYGAISDDNFQNNLFLGIGITQNVTDKIFIETIGQYSGNKMRFADSGFVGYSDLKFRRIGVTIIPAIKLATKFRIGIGLSYQLLRNLKPGFDNRNIWSDFGDTYNQEQLGWVGSFTYEIKSIIVGIRYFNLSAMNKKIFDQVGKTNSLEISVAYRYEVLK